MVDLMMWLVIAALLLATAIQSIGYYQKAAYMSNMLSDLDGAASVVMSTSALSGGELDRTVIEEGVAEAKWTGEVQAIVQQSDGSSSPYIRASHPSIPDSDVVYLFEACGDLAVGANIVPKTGVVGGDCDISASPWEADGDFLMELGGSLSLNREIDGGDWISAATSGDGQHMAAGRYAGAFHTSHDGGETWVERSNTGFEHSLSAAISDDGQKVISTDYNFIYTSHDGGDTWTKRIAPETGGWRAVAISGDGNRVVAANHNGRIYTSTDSGVNWTKQANAPISEWYSIASSGDGRTLIAGQSGGGIYVSTDYGVNWTRQSVAELGTGDGAWHGVSISDNGSVMASGNWWSGYIYVSVNGGATWERKTAAGVARWRDVAISADGKNIAAGESGGYLHTSIDGGATWTKHTQAGSGNWDDLVFVDNGKKLLVSRGALGALYTGMLP